MSGNSDVEAHLSIVCGVDGDVEAHLSTVCGVDVRWGIEPGHEDTGG